MENMIKVLDDDYQALDEYVQANNLDVLKMTHLSGTSKYILHLDDRDDMVEITNRSAKLIDTNRYY